LAFLLLFPTKGMSACWTMVEIREAELTGQRFHGIAERWMIRSDLMVSNNIDRISEPNS